MLDKNAMVPIATKRKKLGPVDNRPKQLCLVLHVVLRCATVVLI